MRVTIPRNTYAKLLNQIKKAKDLATKQVLDNIKITIAPGGAALLWDPSPERLGGIMDHLAREAHFMRKSTGTFQEVTKTIEMLKKHAGREPKPDLT